MKSLGTINAVTPDILDEPGVYHFSMQHHAAYQALPQTLLLHVVLLHEAGEIYTVISDKGFTDTPVVRTLTNLAALARTSGCQPICLTRPMKLDTVSIPKPWGREIWYSGIEQRGVSSICGVPLPWLINVFGDHLGCRHAPMLLKILDPFPEPNLGDLYFEMHQKKIEVYVVTHVDPGAWPTGTGKIRYGFNQSVIREFDSTDGFLDSYRRAVNNYRIIRNEIDARLKKLKAEQGLSSGEPLPPDVYQRLTSQIDVKLIQEEEQLRQVMYRYTSTQDLRVGDVVTVAPMVPHSLQHGVRVIEFQTPHYERYILSFGQEVLTQEHWDTDSALPGAKLKVDEFKAPSQLAPGQDLVANFDEFRVIRINLEPGEAAQTTHKNYTMIIGVSGETAVDDETSLGPEEACFIAPKETLDFSNRGSSPATVLVAEECTAEN